MENFFPSLLLELLGISVAFSVILMAVIQKLKSFACIKKSCHVMIINILLSFAIGIPFAIHFYDITWVEGAWVGLFSFIGASTIYEGLKKQNLINYKPNAVDDTLKISKDNEIKKS